MMDHEAIRRLKRRELLGDVTVIAIILSLAVVSLAVTYIALKP